MRLDALTEDNLYQILTEPQLNLIDQYKSLLKTEGVELEVEDSALKKIASLSFKMNAEMDNIGARRLYSVIELVMKEISLNAEESIGKKVNRLLFL